MKFTGLKLQSRHLEALLVGLVVVGLFCFYGRLIEPVVQNGDAAVYTQQVLNHTFDQRAIHIGYVLVGSVFRALLPIQIDLAMNFMALTFGVGGLLALYFVARRLASRAAGAAAVMFLLGAHVYVRAMLMSEVDILSASLVMISYALYLHRLAAPAGVAFGLAMLSTPVTATLLPLFLFTFAVDARGAKATVRAHFFRVLWFGVASLATYVPFVVWQRQSYFYGGRSLGTAPAAAFDLGRQISRGLLFFDYNAALVLALAVAGIVIALGDRKLWRRDQPALATLLCIVLTAVAADRAGDVPVHLPNLMLVCLFAALFVDRAARGTKVAWLVPFVICALTAPSALGATRREIDEQHELRARYRAMVERSRPYRAMLVGLSGGFTNHRLFEHYAYGASYTGLSLTMAEFRRQLPALRNGPPRYGIFFARGMAGEVVSALAESYTPVTEGTGKTAYKALLPKELVH